MDGYRETVCRRTLMGYREINNVLWCHLIITSEKLEELKK